MLFSPLFRSRRRPRVRVRTALNLDRLEPRTLLSTVSGFASFQGQIGGSAADPIIAQLSPDDFRPAAGRRVVLRLEARAANGSLLDPDATNLESATPGAARILSRRSNVPGGTASVTVAAVRAGSLTIRPQSEGGTEGDYHLSVSLAGDANGDFRVDRRDIRAIRLALGRSATAPSVAPGADVNGDGWVGALDLAFALRNRGASTDLRPLEATLGLDPAADPDGDGTVDADRETADVIGRTAPGATVRLDRGADGSFEANTTAGADGRYRFTVPLDLGLNPLAIVVSDSFGQTTDAQLVVTRGVAVPQPVSASFDFSQGTQGWVAGFADLPADPNDSYELDSGLRPLPPELGTPGTGFLLQSHNRSDDVFMYLKHRLGAADGVVPNQDYEITFTIKFASNAPSNAFGAGGAPGESVILKAGAGPVEPQPVDNNGFVRLNVDIGDQTTGGPGASVVGNIANGKDLSEPGPVPYVSLTKQHTHTFVARSDSQGNLWLLVGTDSGYEGVTALYYQQIAVELNPIVS